MFSLNSLQITPEVLKLIAGMDEFKGAWRALGTLAPERLRALRHVATIESIGSSTRIEGSKLSDREVERLLSKINIGSFASRDEQEVAGYAEVMDAVEEGHEDATGLILNPVEPSEEDEDRIRNIHRSIDEDEFRERFMQLVPYLDGAHALESIAAREGIKRSRMEEWFGELERQGYLLTFRSL